MWTARSEPLATGRGQRLAIDHGSAPATYADVVLGWQTDAELRTLFNSVLADTPYTAFRWETPAVTAATMSRPFEFVLLDSPTLARQPEPEAFAEHFTNASAEVVTCPNLGGDAVLVVPRPIADHSAYGHLAAFVRHGPAGQRHTFWQAVAGAMIRRVSSAPVWLSTAGAGVSWLHARLDDRPKYYGYEPYRRIN